MEIGQFPNKLKQFRRCQGYSQKRLARILGLTDTSTISRWEHGFSVPNIIQVFRLARLYRILPHELLGELWHVVNTDKNLLALDEEPFISNSSIINMPT